ncbi:hypothetical protein HPY42_00995 [Coprothermobacteraceae bacterium]|nr:hypothetical protein [Coprothermobacteraceae bacterium]
MKRWIAGLLALVLIIAAGPVAVSAEEPIVTTSASEPTWSIAVADPAGDDYGPGWYKYATASVFKAGDFDILKFEMKPVGDNYVVTFTMGNIDNPWGGTYGISKQTFFLFFSTDPSKGTTKGVEATNVSFAENFKWNVGLQIEGWDSKVYTVEGDEIVAKNAGELGITGASVEGAPGKLVITIPKSVVGEFDENSKFIAWVTGQDGYGANRLRGFGAEAGEWVFGGGDGTSPKVMDMVVPEGMTQEDILNYKAHTVTLPGLKVADLARAFRGVTIADPAGDDYGPGWYKYATASVFKAGDFDILKFEMKPVGDNYVVTFTMGNIDNPWGGTYGISKQTFFLFFSTDPSKGTTKGVEATNVSFAENFKWNVGLQIEGWDSKVYTVEGDEIVAKNAGELGITGASVEGAPGKLVITIPKSVVGEFDENSKFIAWVTGQDGYGANRLRGFGAEAGEWVFGGGDGTSPKVMDMVVPEGMTQEDILNYKAHTVTLPGISVGDFMASAQLVKVLSPQDGSVTNQTAVDIKINVLSSALTEVVVGGKAQAVKFGENVISGVALPNEGANVVEFKSTDGRLLAKVTIVRDTTPPYAMIIEPFRQTTLLSREVAVKIETEPNAKVLLQLFAPDGREAAAVNTTADSKGMVDIPVAFRAFTGLNILRATVTDAAGNNKVIHSLFAYGRAHEITLKIGSTAMEVNVDTIKLDAAPYIKNSRTMVPLRAIAESLGADVQWDGATKTVTIKLGDTQIRLVVGQNTAYVDGQAVTLDVAPEIKNSRTFVPVRFITEAFGCTVNWDAATKTVKITYP